MRSIVRNLPIGHLKQLIEKETQTNNIDLRTVAAIYSAVDNFYSSCGKNYKIINIECFSFN